MRIHLKTTTLGVLLALGLAGPVLPGAQAIAAEATQRAAQGIDWQEPTRAAFEQARRENKLILLDVAAVWCHWCHVMDATTYADPAVQAEIRRHYVPIKVDHDARPDIAERYRDYGWPATAILSPDGRDLVKKAGYIEPGAMTTLLAKAYRIAQQLPPLQAPETVGQRSLDALPADLRSLLVQRHLDAYDPRLGGLRLGQKFLDLDSVELDLLLAEAGDEAAARRARKTLDAALALIDPAFGGAYQYSTHGDWEHPHYEKIMSVQMNYLLAYSQAYRRFGDARYLRAAEQVAAFLRDFLRAEDGAFYNSQDADLVQGVKGHDYFVLDRQARLTQGLPRIDKHHYASSNGMAIEGLLALYQASGKQAYLREARAALDWVLRNRALPDGGFAHDAQDVAGPYLADSLYMGRALLKMHQVTGEQVWLERALRTARFVAARFGAPDGGLYAAVRGDSPFEPVRQIDQNIQAGRLFMDLYRHQPQPVLLEAARRVMGFLGHRSVATQRLTDAGSLILDAALRHPESNPQQLGEVLRQQTQE